MNAILIILLFHLFTYFVINTFTHVEFSDDHHDDHQAKEEGIN